LVAPRLTKAEQLLEMATAKANELQMTERGWSHGIESTQVRAAIWAVGEMLEQMEKQAVKDLAKVYRQAL
jgi:hypothetical protein